MTAILTIISCQTFTGICSKTHCSSVKKILLISSLVLISSGIFSQERFCPTFGLFVRTNANYGWSAGMMIEMKIKEKLHLFARGDYNKDYWKSETPRHDEYTDTGSVIWISFGIKKNILK
ncbi:MAG: hypothetical protein JW723_13765 [Bacteroidales bacterium]|nr:hypothetical protein [Bacteroidales bacterium]